MGGLERAPQAPQRSGRPGGPVAPLDHARGSGGLERAPQASGRGGRDHAPRRAELLFAYGTLMQGYFLHRVIADRATYLESGSVRGALVDLGRYPGLLEGNGRVVGEVYRIETPELLPVVDREEGYNFQRYRTLVTLGGGRRVRAWAYRYRGPRERATLIADGDYRRVRPPPACRPRT